MENEQWNINENPSSGTRCLVTDGELVVFAKYVSDQTHSMWIFEGLDNTHKFEVIGWMNPPKPLKKKEVVFAYIKE